MGANLVDCGGGAPGEARGPGARGGGLPVTHGLRAPGGAGFHLWTPPPWGALVQPPARHPGSCPCLCVSGDVQGGGSGPDAGENSDVRQQWAARRQASWGGAGIRTAGRLSRQNLSEGPGPSARDSEATWFRGQHTRGRPASGLAERRELGTQPELRPGLVGAQGQFSRVSNPPPPQDAGCPGMNRANSSPGLTAQCPQAGSPPGAGRGAAPRGLPGGGGCGVSGWVPRGAEHRTLPGSCPGGRGWAPAGSRGLGRTVWGESWVAPR